MSTGERGRLPALDGLRGIAALVVVLGHIGLIRPMVDTGPGSLQWWFDHTPLHLLRAGGEAVFVFFVLSGFVLTLPLLRARSPKWGTYYLRRMLRLYLPVWASLVLALVVWWLAGDPRPGASPFVQAAALAVTPSTLLGDVTLAHTSTLNGVLWSLRWEVVFSLLLPLYLYVALALRRLGPVGFIYPLLAVLLGAASGLEALTYLPMFLLGALLAVHLQEVQRAVDGWGPVRRLAAAAATVGLLSAGIVGDGAIVFAVIAAGATLTVAAFLVWSPARAAGTSPAALWIGRRSFSLYLVHTPVLVTVDAVMPSAPGVVLLAVALAGSLLVAAVFCYIVEAPTQRLVSRLRGAKDRDALDALVPARS